MFDNNLCLLKLEYQYRKFLIRCLFDKNVRLNLLRLYLMDVCQVLFHCSHSLNFLMLQGKGLTGLRNIGNTCYMNSILQCLSNTDPLRKKLCSWDIRAINEKSKTRGAVAREVISIMKQLWSGDGGYISCKSLKVSAHYRLFFCILS